MQLLQDTFIIEQLQVINEGKSDGPTRIRGVFGRCNEKNNNGRIYPTAVLESQLEKVKPLILERRLCGELDHPQNDTVKLSNASHLVTKLEMKGDDLIGEAEILKTPAGLTAKALIEGGVKIGISSRGMGTLSEDHNGDKIVNEDFRLVTFDLVADPSTRGAFPGLSESTESKFVRESQSKLTKESNFITMLNSKLRTAYDPWIEEAKTKKKLTKKQREKMDVEPDGGDGDIDAKDLTRLRAGHDKFEEAMELVRADGHWYMIAEAILETYSEITKKEKADSTNKKTLKQLRIIRREQLRANYSGLGAPIPGRRRNKNKEKEAKQNRRQQDQEQIAAGTTYKQIGNILMEAYEDNRKEDEAENAAKAAATALKAPKPRRGSGREGAFARSLRHRSEIRQQKRVRDTDREADKFDSSNRRHQTSQDAISQANTQVTTDAIGQKGSLAKEVRAAKDATTLKRVQHQQHNRQVRQRDKISSAAPGSSRSQGLGGSAREKATDLAGGISKLPGRLKRLPGKVIDKAVEVSDTATKAKIVNQRGRVQRERARKSNADAKKASGPGNAPKPEASTTPDKVTGPSQGHEGRGKPRGESPSRPPVRKSRGPGNAPKPRDIKAQDDRRTAQAGGSKKAKREAEIAAHKDRVAGKPAPAGERWKDQGPTSKSGTNINPNLQRRLNMVQSKKAQSKQNLATSRKRLQATGKLGRTGEGGDISASRAYKQIGSMLAEMFGLNEKLLHTMGDKETQEMRRKYRLDQQGKAPQNRVMAGKSAAQKATLNKELDTKIVQSGGDRKIKV